MTMPGFTAEASTYIPTGCYLVKGSPSGSGGPHLRPAYFYAETSLEDCLDVCRSNYGNCTRVRNQGYCLARHNICVANCAFQEP